MPNATGSDASIPVTVLDRVPSGATNPAPRKPTIVVTSSGDRTQPSAPRPFGPETRLELPQIQPLVPCARPATNRYPSAVTYSPKFGPTGTVPVDALHIHACWPREGPAGAVAEKVPISTPPTGEPTKRFGNPPLDANNGPYNPTRSIEYTGAQSARTDSPAPASTPAASASTPAAGALRTRAPPNPPRLTSLSITTPKRSPDPNRRGGPNVRPCTRPTPAPDDRGLQLRRPASQNGSPSPDGTSPRTGRLHAVSPAHRLPTSA